MNPLERTILRELFGNSEFTDRVVPYVKEEYFHSAEGALIFRLFRLFYTKFTACPQFAAIYIGLDATPKLSEQQAKSTQDALRTVEAEPVLDSSQHAWLMEQTELWCQDRALHCALLAAIKIMDNPESSPHTIPDLMKSALAVSFDTHIGHDYFADAEDRFEFYHRPETKLPFDLDTFNTLTNGGVPRKTLNVVLAGTNVGKSLALCHFAASYLRMSKNVLYITCEMAEEWIGERIDANLFDIPMDDVVTMPQEDYVRKMTHLRKSSTGKLIIKEYPTATASCSMFRGLLQELRLKQNFVPDVILVDYLSICASDRAKVGGANINSYTFNKFISEELRGLAGEFNVPLWTAAQLNREGSKSTDPGLEHVGESFGIPMTADFCVALVSTDELEKLGQISLIELKNRYNKRKTFQQHLLGMDTPRMKLYELNAAQVASALSLPVHAAPAPGQGKSGFSTPMHRRSKPMASLRAEAQGSS